MNKEPDIKMPELYQTARSELSLCTAAYLSWHVYSELQRGRHKVYLQLGIYQKRPEFRILNHCNFQLSLNLVSLVWSGILGGILAGS